MAEYLLPYNSARPHRALAQLPPAHAYARPPRIDLTEHRVRRKQVLGGLTHEYQATARLPVAIRKAPGHSCISCIRARRLTAQAMTAAWSGAIDQTPARPPIVAVTPDGRFREYYRFSVSFRRTWGTL